MRKTLIGTRRCRSGFCLWFAAALLASGTAGASSIPLFEEDWESGAIAAANWSSWGFPSPVLASGGNVIGDHSLDPNGDSSYLSGLVSANPFTLSAGLRVSIDAHIQSATHWSELSFGLAKSSSISQYDEHQKRLATVYIDADPQGSGHMFYARFEGSGGSETDFHATPASVFDAWHTYVFDFAPNGSVRVSVDGASFFESSAGLYDYSTDNEFSLLLGGRSYGSTENLYDSIQVVQVPEPASALLLAFGLAGLGRRRAR